MEQLVAAWAQEYEKKGIPSSSEQSPSNSVVSFITDYQTNKSPKGKIAADIGCGLGRNSFYLAEQGFNVISIDFVEKNIQHIKQVATEKKLPIQGFTADVANPWPIPENGLDLAIDIFCYKHLPSKEKQASYREEICKALKRDGLYFLSLASKEDGFYGPLLQNSPSPDTDLVIDPYAGISSFLYSIESLLREFSDRFQFLQILEKTSTSTMHGRTYPRKMIHAVFQRKRQ